MATPSKGIGRGAPGVKRKPLVVHPKGPGYCRNGHDKNIEGTTPDGRCRVCDRARRAKHYAKTLGAQRARRRAAMAIILDPSIVERDIAEMRARVRARRKAA